MQELITWEPIENLIGECNFDAMINNADLSLTILLTNSYTSKKLSFYWDSGLEAYNINKTCCRKEFITNLEQKYERNIIEHWSFFKILNSTYIQWISEQSYTISDYWRFIHYVIITKEFVIDIVQTHDPIVKWL